METNVKTKPSWRKRRIARPLLLLLALIMVGAGYSVVKPETTTADTDMTTQIEEGKELFDVSCSSCHGLNGEGTSQGPSLIGVGSASVDFQMGTGRMPAARPEAQIPKREVIYSQEQIEAVAAYIASLGTGVEIPQEEQYSPRAYLKKKSPAVEPCFAPIVRPATASSAAVAPYRTASMRQT